VPILLITQEVVDEFFIGIFEGWDVNKQQQTTQLLYWSGSRSGSRNFNGIFATAEYQYL